METDFNTSFDILIFNISRYCEKSQVVMLILLWSTVCICVNTLLIPNATLNLSAQFLVPRSLVAILLLLAVYLYPGRFVPVRFCLWPIVGHLPGNFVRGTKPTNERVGMPVWVDEKRAESETVWHVVGIGGISPGRPSPLCSNENGLSQRTATDTFLITSNITRRARPSFLIKCHIAPAGHGNSPSKQRRRAACLRLGTRRRRRWRWWR